MAEDLQLSPELGEKFLLACENGEKETVRLMLQEHPSLVKCTDEDLYTPLHRASYNDHGEVVKFLLDHGADTEAQTIDGWRPLHSASHWNCQNSANVLIRNGADVNAQSHGGNTPLHISSLKSRAGPQVMRLLLSDPKIDISITNNDSETAKTVAERNGPYGKLFKLRNPGLNEKEDDLCKFTVVTSKPLEKDDFKRN